MGNQIIIKNEESRKTIAVYSTIVDDFIFEGSPKEYADMVAKDAADKARAEVMGIYQELKVWGVPYRNMQMTYEEACNRRDEVHGVKNKESEKQND